MEGVTGKKLALITNTSLCMQLMLGIANKNNQGD